MGKPKFDVGATAKKFLSSVEEPQPEQKEAGPKKNKKAPATRTAGDDMSYTQKRETSGKTYIPESREIGANRPKSVDKDTGEVTKQIGYFVTESQDKKLRQLSVEMNTNKSALVREAIRMYFDYLEREGLK